MNKYKCCVALTMMFVISLGFSQTVTLAVEATYPSDQAELVYEPLKNWLQKKTGFKVNIESADNYYFYWRSAKNNQPEFTLDASHIAAYRMQEKNYIPLARLQEDVSFHLISNFEPAEGQSIGEFLVGEHVVTLPTPNMGSVLYDQWFTDLFLQPRKIVTALSWEDVLEQVFAQSANAAIIPSHLFELYPNFLSLKESDAFPGMTFLAAPSVDPNVRKIFKDAILSLGEDDESYEVLAELNSDGFIETTIEDYKELDKILVEIMR